MKIIEGGGTWQNQRRQGYSSPTVGLCLGPYSSPRGDCGQRGQHASSTPTPKVTSISITSEYVVHAPLNNLSIRVVPGRTSGGKGIPPSTRAIAPAWGFGF